MDSVYEQKRQTNRRFCYLLAFLIPSLIVWIGYMIRGIAPFGKYSLITIDASGQYLPMLTAMRRAILGDGDIFHSFEGALGYNVWAQSAYYTNSPLWFILLFVPETYLVEAADLLVLLRFGLSGLTCAYWMAGQKGAGRLYAVEIIGFSTAYALCGWSLAFINQLMWMDAFLLFPLVLAGLERLKKGGSPLLYLISLFITIWSNFYIAYMVCLFCVLYAIYLLLSEPIDWKRTGQFFARFAVWSLLAAGLSAAVLFPIKKALDLTLASELGFEGTLKWYHPWKEVFARFLPFQNISLEFQAPNLYGSLMVLLCTLFFWLDSDVLLRKKLAVLCIGVFFLISFNLNFLDYVWHGFHYPNQLPGRQSFLFIGFMVLIGLEGYIGIRRRLLKLRRNGKVTKGRYYQIYISLASMLFVLLFLEVSSNAWFDFGNQVRVFSRSGYHRYTSAMEQITEEYNPQENEFYRMEWMKSGSNFNSGQKFGYYGVNYYSSTMSGLAYNFFQDNGFSRYAKNVSLLYYSSQETDAVLGVKYVLEPIEAQEDESLIEPKNRLKLIGIYDNIRVYENPEAFSIGFMVNLDANTIKHASLTELYRYSTGEQMELEVFEDSHVKGYIRNEKAGMLCFSVSGDGGFTLWIDGKMQELLPVANYMCGIYLEAGEHTVELKYTVPGLYGGVAVSVLCLFLSIGMWFLEKKTINKEA